MKKITTYLITLVAALFLGAPPSFSQTESILGQLGTEGLIVGASSVEDGIALSTPGNPTMDVGTRMLLQKLINASEAQWIKNAGKIAQQIAAAESTLKSVMGQESIIAGVYEGLSYLNESSGIVDQFYNSYRSAWNTIQSDKEYIKYLYTSGSISPAEYARAVYELSESSAALAANLAETLSIALNWKFKMTNVERLQQLKECISKMEKISDDASAATAKRTYKIYQAKKEKERDAVIASAFGSDVKVEGVPTAEEMKETMDRIFAENPMYKDKASIIQRIGVDLQGFSPRKIAGIVFLLMLITDVVLLLFAFYWRGQEGGGRHADALLKVFTGFLISSIVLGTILLAF